MVQISKYLQKLNCRLKILNLEDTNLGDAGANVISESISKNHSLVELNIAKNKIYLGGIAIG